MCRLTFVRFRFYCTCLVFVDASLQVGHRLLDVAAAELERRRGVRLGVAELGEVLQLDVEQRYAISRCCGGTRSAALRCTHQHTHKMMKREMVGINDLLGAVGTKPPLGAVGTKAPVGAVNIEAAVGAVGNKAPVGAIGIKDPLGAIGTKAPVGAVGTKAAVGAVRCQN